MIDKCEVFHLFVNFYRMVRTQFTQIGSPTKRLCSDNRREYVNQNVSKFLRKMELFMK